MKRKRVARKKKVTDNPAPSANVDERAFINFVAQSVQENYLADETNNTRNQSDQLNAGVDRYSSGNDRFHVGENSRSLSSFSASDCDESIHVELSSGDEAAVVSKKKQRVSEQFQKKSGKAPMQTSGAPIMPRGGSFFNVQPLKGSGSKSMRPFKGLSSEFPPLKKLSEDPRYNKLELKACLAVIKKVMEMEEARPFNAPVDPVAQGVPDYFSVIDTPMDFGTICSNLQNGVKYMDAGDVYKDVNYIWENCLKYNKKGDYIVYLMKRVKKKFWAYWKSAGLRSEILGEHNGPSHSLPSSNRDMWLSRHEAMPALNRMVTNSYGVQQDRIGTSQPQSQASLSGNIYPCLSRQLQPNIPQVPSFSQSRAGVGSSYTDITRGRAPDAGGGHRGSQDSSGKTTPQDNVRAKASKFNGTGPYAPDFFTPDSLQTTQDVHTPSPSVHNPLLPTIFRRGPQLVPPEPSPDQEIESEPEEQTELEQELDPESGEDEGDSVPVDRIEITVIGDMFLPSDKCSRAIRKIFQRKLHIDGAKWKTVPPEMKEYYFQEFKRHFSWDPSIDHQVRYAWNKKAGSRYSDLLSEMRKKGVRPAYVPKVVWKKWLEVWSDPEYVRILRQSALNRRKGEIGPAPPSHTGGSLANMEHRKRLAEQLGRDPTPHELFVYTHTRKHDGKTFVNEKAKEINERAETIKEQMTQNSSTVDESQVFLKAVGGLARNKVYGLGSVERDYFKSLGQAEVKYRPPKPMTPTSAINEAAELQKQLEELKQQQQSTAERHEERYNVLLETIKKQTEIISSMQQKIESTAQIAGPADVAAITGGGKSLKSKPKTRARR